MLPGPRPRKGHLGVGVALLGAVIAAAAIAALVSPGDPASLLDNSEGIMKMLGSDSSVLAQPP